MGELHQFLNTYCSLNTLIGMPLEGDQVMLKKSLKTLIEFNDGLVRLDKLDLDVLAVVVLIQRMHFIVVQEGGII